MSFCLKSFYRFPFLLKSKLPKRRWMAWCLPAPSYPSPLRHHTPGGRAGLSAGSFLPLHLHQRFSPCGTRFSWLLAGLIVILQISAHVSPQKGCSGHPGSVSCTSHLYFIASFCFVFFTPLITIYNHFVSFFSLGIVFSHLSVGSRT